MNLSTHITRRNPLPLDRMFDDFFGPALGYGHYSGDNSYTWTPRTDVSADGDAYLFSFDLPGVKKEDIDISVESGVLTVSGERHDTFEETDKANVYRRESIYGSFSRSFKLPSDGTPDGVEATYHDGVLTVRVPKAEEVKARKIAVS